MPHGLLTALVSWKTQTDTSKLRRPGNEQLQVCCKVKALGSTLHPLRPCELGPEALSVLNQTLTWFEKIPVGKGHSLLLSASDGPTVFPAGIGVSQAGPEVLLKGPVVLLHHVIQVFLLKSTKDGPISQMSHSFCNKKHPPPYETQLKVS